ncbi:hypothetical protein D8674_019350 [Pyrus ussuriensis x Pyrus communis]|uniref:Uncharacterized protein n=1 Tax=Pyrus ussuriensis x Pyrus communis TaxID=2448454 RepID=A0A5N5G7S2_9ROSA|nr:hypothetical protein D8674_019350 [Pyrus ussuriensis x Pyrus communis]
MFFAFLSSLEQQGHKGKVATCNNGGNKDESNARGVNEDDDDEEEKECTDKELIDSDYEHEEEDDIPVAQFEEQFYEEDDNMFVENVDNRIEEEPEEVGLIGEISDEVLSSDLDSIVSSEEDEECVEVTSKRRRQRASQMPKFKH